MTRVRDGLPDLSACETTRALSTLGLSATPTVEGLRQIFTGWMFASPFHNLDLLAGLDGLPAPTNVDDAVRQALSGRGGPCHVQAAGFAALLRALGFAVVLLPATVKEPNDHLVVGVTVGGARYVCDVGNGHPYPAPFDFDQPESSSRWGWRFSTVPTPLGLRLHRTFPNGEQKQVYIARWEPRAYEDFADNIAAHHGTVGFGPFMTGLRAVRYTRRGMLLLRDTRYERHTDFAATSRVVRDASACAALLAGPFGLGGAPIDRALAGLARSRDIFQEAAEPHVRPTIFVTVSATGRPGCLKRLVESLAASLHAEGENAPRVELLVVENSTRADHREWNRRIVETAAATDVVVELNDDGHHGRSIARSRERQTELVRARAAVRPPDCVWMIDDDLTFSRLSIRDGVETSEPLSDIFTRAMDLRAAHPDVSLLIGPVTGDAHVRPEATLRLQLFDLAENLVRIGDLDPGAAAPTPDIATITALPDYYYDHSRAGHAHLDVACPWVPRRAPPGTVRDELLAYLDACMGILAGAHATRPLVEADDPPPSRSSAPLRGGNALFFDLDACLSHTYPTASLDGLDSRRSDMIGATLLAREGYIVAHGPLSLEHARDAGEGPTSASARWRSLRSEFHGVLLARLVMDGVPGEADPPEHLRRLAIDRARVVSSALAAARDQLVRIDRLRLESRAWWRSDPEVCTHLDRVSKTLWGMWNDIVDSPELPTVEHRLAALERRLVDANDLAAVMSAWRDATGAGR